MTVGHLKTAMVLFHNETTQMALTRWQSACPTLSHLSHFVPAVGQVGTAQLAVPQHLNPFCPILSQNKTPVGQESSLESLGSLRSLENR